MTGSGENLEYVCFITAFTWHFENNGANTSYGEYFCLFIFIKLKSAILPNDNVSSTSKPNTTKRIQVVHLTLTVIQLRREGGSVGCPKTKETYKFFD